MGHSAPGEPGRPRRARACAELDHGATPGAQAQRTHSGEEEAADAKEQDAFDPAAPMGAAEPRPLHEAEAASRAPSDEAEQSYEAEEAEQAGGRRRLAAPTKPGDGSRRRKPRCGSRDRFAAADYHDEPEAARGRRPFEAPSVVAQRAPSSSGSMARRNRGRRGRRRRGLTPAPRWCRCPSAPRRRAARPPSRCASTASVTSGCASPARSPAARRSRS